jgi:HK97 gp10 family phage protein
MTVRVEGDERIIRKLLATALLSEDVSLLVPSAELIATELRARAPRGTTGDLVESIEVTVEGNTVTVGPDPSGFYGHFLEYGTSKMSARPWFRPAVDHSLRPAMTTLGRSFANAIERAWR